ncbi:MAG: Rrf2 family transcriptional regulator [Candidatus Krumholzibacteriota bacterium]|nr:Rrf2 family transcriptional regulator [Candidatus Krumholzibacteriota bacterium]
MEILRRNTDYALRALVILGRTEQDMPVPASKLAEREKISYPLTCKLLQKLQKAKIVQSRMGPSGGFQLRRDSSDISLLEIIEAIQGRILVNACFSDDFLCEKSPTCLTKAKLQYLQDHLENYFSGLTLADIIEDKGKRKKTVRIR